MQPREIKNIINQVEKNFRDYYTLINPLKESESSINKPSKEETIKAFLLTQAAVEEEIIEFRLKKILEEEHPYIPPINLNKFKPDNWRMEKPLFKTVDEFLKQKQDLIKLLYSTPSNSWDRTGVHEEEGHISFEEIVRRIIQRDGDNLKKLREQLTA